MAQAQNYRKAKGVFVVICDGECGNCWLSGEGWNFRGLMPEMDGGFVDMNGKSPCSCLKKDHQVLVIKHRTDNDVMDRRSDIDFDVGADQRFRRNYKCKNCRTHSDTLYCEECIRKINKGGKKW